MKFLQELKSSALIIGLSIVIATVGYLVATRYYVHVAYNRCVTLDRWTGKVTVTDVK